MLAIASGCGDDAAPSDDAGAREAGAPHAGGGGGGDGSDAAFAGDAAANDTARPDAAHDQDAATGDAGSHDAGGHDAGGHDAGAHDAGDHDAGDGGPSDDTDTDSDGIPDVVEGNGDFDADGDDNRDDLDADGDCRPDALEATTSPPGDFDADDAPDFLDRDSDDDRLADQAEDANCNGVLDPGETDPLDEDSDDDGASDAVEAALGTDARDALDHPAANGELVVVVEPGRTPAPTSLVVEATPRITMVDAYVLIDRSGSMAAEISAIRTNLAAAIDALQCAPTGTGSAPNCIPDLWAGAGTVGYSGASGQPFTHHVDLQSNPSFAGIPTTEPGGCCDEPLTFGVWAAITGGGSAASGCTVASVAARATCVGSPAASAGYATSGYPCFRQGALPLVLLATDEAPLSGTGTYECPAWASVQAEMLARNAKLIGILGSDTAAEVSTDLSLMAQGTGAVDGDTGNAPIVLDGSNATAATAIQNGIRTLLDSTPLDVSLRITDDPSDAVDTVAAFVTRVETHQTGSAACSAGLAEQDTDADTHADRLIDVPPGTPVCFRIVTATNASVPATTSAQVFSATLDVLADDVAQAGTRQLRFVVLPAEL